MNLNEKYAGGNFYQGRTSFPISEESFIKSIFNPNTSLKMNLEEIRFQSRYNICCNDVTITEKATQILKGLMDQHQIRESIKALEFF